MSCCSYLLSLVIFFFFKQKPAYEMRISDCSSDVCSSDLATTSSTRWPSSCASSAAGSRATTTTSTPTCACEPSSSAPSRFRRECSCAASSIQDFVSARTEERRVGKGWVSTCRSRGSPHQSKKKNDNLFVAITHEQS